MLMMKYRQTSNVDILISKNSQTKNLSPTKFEPRSIPDCSTNGSVHDCSTIAPMLSLLSLPL